MTQRGHTEGPVAPEKSQLQAFLIDLREIHDRRPTWHVTRESRFPYDQLVDSGMVDRGAWARVVRELLDQEAAPATEGGKPRIHGAKTRFAAKVGVAVRTVDSWLRSEVDVKEASVKAVAEAFGLNAINLLIRVGFYTREQMPAGLSNEQIDEEQRVVLELSDIGDLQKAMILQALEEMRQVDERILDEQRTRDRRRRQERVTELIERARRSA
jgi:hypothetical protein